MRVPDQNGSDEECAGLSVTSESLATAEQNAAGTKCCPWNADRWPMNEVLWASNRLYCVLSNVAMETLMRRFSPPHIPSTQLILHEPADTPASVRSSDVSLATSRVKPCFRPETEATHPHGAVCVTESSLERQRQSKDAPAPIPPTYKARNANPQKEARR